MCEVPGKPFVWLKGPFTLHSAAPYGPGPNRTLRTAGPFTASLTALDPTAELVAAGLPFLHQPLCAETTFTLPQPTSSLRFTGGQADALHLMLDDRVHGWIWGPDWTLTLPQPLAAGPHRLSVALVPSTYNHFGPHHYYHGDWHIVSPGQVIGEKKLRRSRRRPRAHPNPRVAFQTAAAAFFCLRGIWGLFARLSRHAKAPHDDDHRAGLARENGGGGGS